MKPKYIIDTCSFTQLRRTYPRDVFPSTWEKVSEMADKNHIASIDEVLEELKAQETDEVLQFARAHKTIFLPLDKSIQNKASDILSKHPNLLDVKNSKSGADPFLIGAAIVHACTIVTEETPTKNALKPKIPDVCTDYGLRCINFLGMLREECFKV